MPDKTMTNVALFPIPNCVAFPGTIFPLHVFEPRYRKMVEYCTTHHIPMGICHTEKILRQAKQNQSLKETLNSNQTTYKPQRVFSAGRCELVETFEDGRMRVDVHLSERLEAVEEVQSLPFSIYTCHKYTDEPANDTCETQAAMTQQKILTRLIAITDHLPEIKELLSSEKWQEKSPRDFSFEIFGLLRLDSDSLQSILESRSVVERLDRTLRFINQSKG